MAGSITGEKPLFACYMGDAINGNGDGEITFVAINPDHFTGEIHWAPVTRKSYWEVEMSHVRLGGKPLVGAAQRAAIERVHL
jgi:hypothetical protein